MVVEAAAIAKRATTERKLLFIVNSPFIGVVWGPFVWFSKLNALLKDRVRSVFVIVASRQP